jgi:hypothetical protein
MSQLTPLTPLGFVISCLVGGLGAELIWIIGARFLERRRSAPLRAEVAELEREIQSFRAVLGAEIAYAYRLEHVILELRASCLVNPDSAVMQDVVAADLQELLDSRPPVSDLVECIGARDWSRFELRSQAVSFGRSRRELT